MTARALNATGTSVFGDNWTGNVPAPSAQAKGNDMHYFNNLIDRWVRETGKKVGEKHAEWTPAKKTQELVTFTVSTTIDQLINGLEEGVRAPNDLLDEMRRVVGGATVELNGLTIGSSPGAFTVAPGIHQMKISRQWMTPWTGTVQIQEGSHFNVALELSDEGLKRYVTLEAFRSAIAVNYAEALMRKDIKINFDTSAWRDVGVSQDTIVIK